ncbi:uncharacterized protein SPAPADRAFT_143424 [Spathaspora passalidarum NRRL Y-27907]|uniref:Mif2/CENP-C cupin domain-containing protein n=1 Tax=Spathaspora passalidarum (strain NRRL Y-27907 / 11-Y1) TaxID=619300 RepID=G3AUR4_SPAPN|nr:uncharacterized protein SPAPADRAFT_143424 [Spathaspora passalidarum NRRL Y-27907]EGW30620.1 hypothetical protein SPAPADRAFT_143424 [Spathaspora passalidarum NRRL Y-27907]
MDLLDLGTRGRKTQLELPSNINKDENGMEDLNDFFNDSDVGVTSNRGISRVREPPSTSTSRKLYQETSLGSRKEFTDVARKIDFTNISPAIQMIGPTKTGDKSTTATGTTGGNVKNKKSPLRSPLHEHQGAALFTRSDSDSDRFEQDPAQFDQDMDSFEQDPTQFDVEEEEEQQQEIEVRKRPRQSKGASRLTKNMALGKSSKRKMQVESESDDAEDSYILDDTTQSDRLLSPPPTLKKPARQASKPRTKPVQKPLITKPSPLPSPPPDGLRRSKRTRIAPLAFWRNERIIYTRAGNVDGDTTLVQDIRKIPLQEIKEVVHMPEVAPVEQRKKPKPKSKSPKTRSPKEYSVDADVPGAEWFDDKYLTMSVNDENGNPKEENIAYTIDGGEVQDTDENIKVTKLFDVDRDFCSTGVIEIPPEGLKSTKLTGSSLFIFHVISGLNQVTINKTTFLANSGCSFQIPYNNSYSITNIGETDSKLLFMQVRKPMVIEEELDDSWQD